VEAARTVKMWKPQKQGSHIFTVRWKTRRRKKALQRVSHSSHKALLQLFYSQERKDTNLTQGWRTKVLIVVEEKNS
jgi:hypothetical protein